MIPQWLSILQELERKAKEAADGNLQHSKSHVQVSRLFNLTSEVPA